MYHIVVSLFSGTKMKQGCTRARDNLEKFSKNVRKEVALVDWHYLFVVEVCSSFMLSLDLIGEPFWFEDFDLSAAREERGKEVCGRTDL